MSSAGSSFGVCCALNAVLEDSISDSGEDEVADSYGDGGGDGSEGSEAADSFSPFGGVLASLVAESVAGASAVSEGSDDSAALGASVARYVEDSRGSGAASVVEAYSV